MTLLELVNATRRRAGVKKAALATLVGATGMDADLLMWVQDVWTDLQNESQNWWFRACVDQTLALAASDDDYAIPTGLETINPRTVTVYENSKQDESDVFFMPYEDWRVSKDTVETSEGRPRYYTITPHNVINVWPVPDQIYTLRFDGVYDIDEPTLDADLLGKTITNTHTAPGFQTLENRYHWYIVWAAVARYAETHEDSQTLARAQSRVKAERGRLSERKTPRVWVKPGRLTGVYHRNTGYRWR